jgi:hypothetical protein
MKGMVRQSSKRQCTKLQLFVTCGHEILNNTSQFVHLQIIIVDNGHLAGCRLVNCRSVKVWLNCLEKLKVDYCSEFIALCPCSLRQIKWCLLN